MQRDSSFYLLIKILSRLSRTRKRQLFALTILMITSASFETLSLALVIPFVSAIANPSALDDIWISRLLLILFGGASEENTASLVTIAFMLFALISGGVRVLNSFATTFTAANVGADLSSEIYSKLVNLRYEDSFGLKKSAVTAAATTQTTQVAIAVDLLLQFVSSTLLTCLLCVGIFLVSPGIAIASFLIFSLLYISLSFLVKPRLRVNSIKVEFYSRQQFKKISETIAFIKDIILADARSHAVKEFQNNEYTFRRAMASSQSIAAFPRYAFESIGLMLIALIPLVLKINDSVNPLILPKLAALAFGAQKLLPSFQQIYASMSGISSRKSEIISVGCYFFSSVGGKIATTSVLSKSSENVSNRKAFSGAIEFLDVSYTYPGAKSKALENISISIGNGEFVAIMGSSGSGKSTFIDLLMGLLHPSYGMIKINGNITLDSDSTSSWHQHLAHVPQDICLKNDTLRENIVMGSSSGFQSNDGNLELACKLAHVFDDYTENLSFETVIDESSSQLSGGQKQRIGLARALFREPKILVLDEATSALDKTNQGRIIDSLLKLKGHMTIVMITHSLDVAKFADSVYVLGDDGLVKIGKNMT